MTDVSATEPAVLDATVLLAARGDRAAFARLVGDHNETMARVAYVICGDRETAHDAVQTAWMLAWRRLSSLRDPSHVRSWLVAIAANEARRGLRRQRRRSVVELSVGPQSSDGGDPGGRVALVDLERALKHLKPDDRSLLALRYIAGLDSTEIALQLGGTPSGVRSRLSRLLERLRMDLDHD